MISLRFVDASVWLTTWAVSPGGIYAVGRSETAGRLRLEIVGSGDESWSVAADERFELEVEGLLDPGTTVRWWWESRGKRILLRESADYVEETTPDAN